jgi:ribosomal protein L37AE/L43A
MIDRLTAEQVGELEGPASRLARGVGDMNDMEKMVRHLPSLLATAKREAVQDRIIAGDGADSDSALACLMYVAMAGKEGWDRIAPQHVSNMLARMEAFKKATTSAEQRAVEAEGRVKELTAAMESIRDVKDEIGGDDSDQMVYVLHVACTALAQPPESKEPSIYNRMTCPTCGSDLVPTAGPLSNIWKCPKCKESKIPPCPSPASPNCDCAECKMWEEPRP